MGGASIHRIQVKTLKWMIFILSLIFILLFFSYPYADIEITEWYNNAGGALSITFDDCDENQYLIAYPIMRKYGIRGSFGVVTSWVGKTVEQPENIFIKRMSWDEIRDLGDNEISSHSCNHKLLTELNEKDLLFEIQESKKIIEKQTGKRCITMHYPFSRTDENIKNILKQSGYLCARTLESEINRDPDLYEVSSYAVFDDDHPSLAELNELLDLCIKERGWIVLMYHHIDENPQKYTTGTYLPLCVTPETFEEQMKLFSSKDIWIAPLGEVAIYLREKRECEIEIEKSFTKIKLFIKSDYNVPLTLKINLSWRRVRVKGSLNDGEYSGSFYLNVLPNREIVIYREFFG